MAEDKYRTWYEFTQDVTMHGVRYVHLRNISITRRLLWLVLILASLVYFCYASSLFLRDFAQKKVSTKLTEETVDELEFPAITLCNNNLWSNDSMTNASLRLNTFGLFDVMEDLYDQHKKLPPPADKYNWSSPYLAPIANMTEKQMYSFFREAAHPLKKSVFNCDIFGESVECADVFQTLPTDKGFCFQFNSEGRLKTVSPGKTGGISMVLKVNIDQYTTGPSSYSEGFTIVSHEPHGVPVMSELGIGVSPGTEANLVLHKSLTDRVPPPADGGKANCFDTEKKPNPLHIYLNYTFAACLTECETTYVINKCGCHEPLQPPLNNTPLCSFPTMLNCSTPALRTFARDPAGLRRCQCKVPCVETEYIAKMSTTSFPSTNFVRTHDLSLEDAKANYIMVNIFYGKMSYLRIDEEITYDIIDMVANVGGTLSLCIGTSILTICEFIEFGILSLLTRMKKRVKNEPPMTKHTNVAPLPDSLA